MQRVMLNYEMLQGSHMLPLVVHFKDQMEICIPDLPADCLTRDCRYLFQCLHATQWKIFYRYMLRKEFLLFSLAILQLLNTAKKNFLDFYKFTD